MHLYVVGEGLYCGRERWAQLSGRPVDPSVGGQSAGPMCFGAEREEETVAESKIV